MNISIEKNIETIRKTIAIDMYFNGLKKKDKICETFNIKNSKLNTWIDEEYKKYDHTRVITTKAIRNSLGIAKKEV